MSWQTVLFKTSRGDRPVSDYIESLDKSTIKKIVRAIEAVSKYGTATPQPFNKKINKDIYEIRTTGKLNIRILYTNYRDSLVLLHIYKKKTNKLPTKELATAESRLKQYIFDND
jgi:phage-related protein